jgi:putative oxidoreductase
MSSQMNLALLLLRAAAGSMIATHGVAHIWKKGKITIRNTAGWFGSMGMKQPLVQAWLASITEVGSGALLMAGLLTPLAAAGLLGVMVVAFLIAHRSNGFFIYNEGQGWEYVAIIMAIAVSIGLLGPGRWSIDHMLDISFSATQSVLILSSGIVGAIGLLAVFWRRPRP